MGSSQLKVYRYTDASAPSMTGTVGSLLGILDACLVSGYGSQSAAGWTKPYANSGNIGCYQNSGSNMCLVVNDNAPGAGGAKEARLMGYEALTSVSAGINPFPSSVLAQGTGGSGFVVARKSATADATTRPWLVLADAYTFYLFCQTGDGASTYMCCGFGDVYSLAGTADAWRCFISGRTLENTTALNNDSIGQLATLTTGNTGSYIARTSGGGGWPLQFSKHGDSVRGSNGLFGSVPTPNPSNNSLYISPVWVAEAANGALRGRMRAMWQLCHPIGSFIDGQIISGNGDYAGKTFMCIKQIGDLSGNFGLFLAEISATVETN